MPTTRTRPRPPAAAPTTLAALTADPANRRHHDARNLDAITASLKAVGAARSIVIDEDNVILAGNGVTQAAQAAGLRGLRIIEASGDEIIAVRRRGLTAEQKRALAMYDNRAAELASWNVEQLLADQAAGLDLGAWFSDEELAALLNPGGAPKAGQTDPDDVPEVRATDIQRGDLFELGAHRILCGDATYLEDVTRVMGREVAQLVFTDPPYGVAYDGGTTVRTELVGDRDTALYAPACRMAVAVSDPKAALYLWHAGVKASAAAAAARAAGYEIRSELVWNKNQAQFGALSAHYKQKHEPCYYCIKRGRTPRWYGPTNEVTIWDCDRAKVNEFHPTQKPVELAERACTNSSASGDRVVDFFVGSGSTVIACERLGRIAHGMEIEPQYVQVTIDRWEAFTGQTATKVGEAARPPQTTRRKARA